mgnify:CR=1 FL=1
MITSQSRDKGVITGFVVGLVLSFTAVAGLAVDSGRIVSARVSASDHAENAARVGAQEVTLLRLGWRFLDPTITDIAAPTRRFDTPNIRSTRQPRRGNPMRCVLDPKWWDAPIDMSQYDGMTQSEIHKDMQREWAELRKRMAAN